MEQIRYMGTHKSSVPWSGNKSEWFGFSGILTKGVSLLDTLNTTKREKSDLEKFTEAYKRLEKAHVHAQHKVESNKVLAQTIEYHKREILYLTQEIEKVKKAQKLINNSVLKIQKVARGFLVRKNLENEIMTIRRLSVKTWITYLKKNDDHYIFELGPKPQHAAIIIQRFVRNLLFKFKIRRIKRVYDILRAQKVEEIQNYIKKILRVFYSKHTIANIKFENFRSGRLQEIREKLSIISVKNYWRKVKFSFKIIMQKIRKYKRMKKNEERMRAPSNKNLTVQGKHNNMLSQKKGDFLNVNDMGNNRNSRGSILDSDAESGSGDEDGKDAKVETQSVASEINRKLEKERQAKISTSKVSYSIPKQKEPSNVLPYLYQKDILEGVSPPNHYISVTRATTFRMNDSNPKRFSPTRNSSTNLDRQSILLSLIKPYTSSAPRPKAGADGNPIYMKPTTASKMSRWDAEAPDIDLDDGKKIIQPREDSKVMSSTFASIQKVSRAYTKKDKISKPWRPNTQHNQPYVSNVDNTSFIKTNTTFVRPSTMNFSPRHIERKRVQSAASPIPENKYEVNSLSFEAALPGLSNMISSYNTRFVVRVRPRIEHIKRFSK
ncbi:hypothetical protein SteCoe_14904 [Stentor coeruleus]|uniref:Uncharacterized protein n=1 Tax=Stentor coeruleus TaxID=5963 RepID=A0A1R2C526_9CILI|nr:hypothetical protein SteCoe_14904 [Stentor coeruleus]